MGTSLNNWNQPFRKLSSFHVPYITIQVANKLANSGWMDPKTDRYSVWNTMQLVKERNLVISNDMDGPVGNLAGWNKPAKKS